MSIVQTNQTMSGRKSDPEGVVKMEGLTFEFVSRMEGESQVFALGPLSLSIHDGELLAVLGPSGAGKTTLLRLLSGLQRPNGGRMRIDGRTVFQEGTVFVEPEKRHVGMLFQDHALFPHLTVRKNILFGIQRWAKDDRERRLYELEDLLGLKSYLQRYPHQLSGGQQQRVALARTLAPRPKVILLDEPLSSIDADLRGQLAQELRDVIKRAGTTAIWITHDQTEALDLADRILVLNRGKLEQLDTPWNLYNTPRTRFVADFIGHTVFLPGELKGKTILTEVGAIDYLPCLQDFQKLEVMLRPDDVKLTPHDSGIGVVIKRQFWGAMQLYTIALPSGRHLLSTQSAHINWPLGTQVRITLGLKSVVAFPVSDG